ncbi:MAG TPA: FKBP-type peptidyl-prolyl cis-trans isomerase [Solirubrobacteraceae bacterium]|nr:FKBP-type peptidyl-prolyl cis-trans isomerase [Solirubrobacteraceae bacterium]
MRARLLPLVTLLSAVALAACGSTNYADTDHIVPAPDQAQTLKPPKTKIPVTASPSTSSSTAVPSSGPLSTEPKITVPSTAAPTSLVTKDIITGTGAAAANGDELTVDYVGALYKNGKVFDASWSHGGPKGVAFPFELGVGDVIKGWDKGLVGMRVGGRRELIIPPSLGYGAKGEPPTIPANSTLIFIIDLLKVKK